jgi:15-cis-phytoene synthase
MNSYGITGAKLQRKSGVSYYLATLFFAEPLRSDVFVLYGFVRQADDLVDNTGSETDRREALFKFKNEYQRAILGQPCQSEVISDFVALKQSRNFSPEYIEAFFQAMEQDTRDNFTYHTYADLQNYMYGSATVIGYMMTELIGYRDDALPAARALAEAMQLTNFLRDIREDFESYGRIYLPEEDLSHFGITRDDFKKGEATPQTRNLIQHLVIRAEKLYKESESGIKLLDKNGRTAVLVSSRLYQGILKNIKKSNFDPWNTDCHTSLPTKIFIILKTLCLKK